MGPSSCWAPRCTKKNRLPSAEGPRFPAPPFLADTMQRSSPPWTLQAVLLPCIASVQPRRRQRYWALVARGKRNGKRKASGICGGRSAAETGRHRRDRSAKRPARDTGGSVSHGPLARETGADEVPWWEGPIRIREGLEGATFLFRSRGHYPGLGGEVFGRVGGASGFGRCVWNGRQTRGAAGFCAEVDRGTLEGRDQA